MEEDVDTSDLGRGVASGPAYQINKGQAIFLGSDGAALSHRMLIPHIRGTTCTSTASVEGASSSADLALSDSIIDTGREVALDATSGFVGVSGLAGRLPSALPCVLVIDDGRFSCATRPERGACNWKPEYSLTRGKDAAPSGAQRAGNGNIAPAKP